MSVRRGLAALTVAALASFPFVVRAETRQASIGNYWFEDDVQRDRTKIVVRKGDQITFTVREGIYPPHSVTVDELGISSPELLLGQTYTTPRLDRAGSFRLYCRAHEGRGHVTRLVVQPVPAAATAPPKPAATRPPARSAAPAASRAPSVTPPVAASPAPATPRATLTPVGVGRASDASLARPVRRDPDSFEGILGRDIEPQPWTRALWLLLIASVPMIAAAAFALRRDAARRAAARDAAPSPKRPARSTARSPRSSGTKASGSARTSRGRTR